MFILPILLLAALFVVMYGGNSMKKKGSLSQAAYQMLISVSSIVVTLAALTVMIMRIRTHH